LLRSKRCIGLLGGRPHHAIYFVGYKDNNTLIGLDPHVVYPAPTLHGQFPSEELRDQVHCGELESLDFSRLDPSLALAFYFRNRGEFEAWISETKQAELDRSRSSKRTAAPLFTIEHSPPCMFSGEYGGDDDENEADDADDDDFVLV